MTTTATILIIVFVLLAVVLGGLVMSMRAKSRRDNEARAGELRSEADRTTASTLPDAEVQAKRAEADAEEARLVAQRADARANEARTGVVQQQAHHEDQVRAADRLDPRVDQKADDYRPTSTAADSDATDATDATSEDTRHA